MTDRFARHSLHVSELLCVRGNDPILDGVSFDLHTGHAITVTGANGSGKSSLLRIIGGLMSWAGGEVVLKAGDTAVDLAAHSHYVGHHLGLEDSRSVSGNILFAIDLLGGDRGSVADLASQLGLEALLSAPVRQLSAGERKRVALARLLIAPRPLWLLDEPTAALDTAGAAILGKLATNHLAQGGMILCATHGALPFPITSELRLIGGVRETPELVDAGE